MVSFSLLNSCIVIDNSIPWIVLLLHSYVNKFFNQRMKRVIHCMSFLFVFNDSSFSVLLRLSDYLHSCMLYASNSGFIGSKMESKLPAPRDGNDVSFIFPIVRECFDRIHPTVELKQNGHYAGCVLIQNPSALLQMKNWDEEDERVKALLSSSVVTATSILHFRCTFFLPSRISTRCSFWASPSRIPLSCLAPSIPP